MRKQIVEIDGKFYLRKFCTRWEFAEYQNLKNGEEIYWWGTDHKHNAVFPTLEELEKAIEEYPGKKKERLMKEKAENEVKVIKTLWFKKL